MSHGRSKLPCNSYRPWKGQEPLCGNCAWTEEEHKGLAEKWEKLQAENARLGVRLDEQMLQLKACEHIAEGDEGWEGLVNICPSTMAVAALREQIAAAVKAERERIRDALITDHATGAGDYSEAEEYADKILGK